MRVRRTQRREAEGARPAGGGAASGRVAERHFDQALRAVLKLSSLPPEELLARVESAGQRLLRQPSHETLAAYKEAVADFLSRAVHDAYTVDQRRGLDRRGRPRREAVLRLVDQHLDELTRQVLAGAPARLAATLDEIRGLLLDLYR